MIIMTNTEMTVMIYFSNGSSQVYNLDATDGTEGALLEIVSGGEIGTAAQGLTPVSIVATCENQCEYVSLVDNLGVVQWSTGGCRPEAGQQAEVQAVPPRVIGLNWSLKCLTAAS